MQLLEQSISTPTGAVDAESPVMAHLAAALIDQIEFGLASCRADGRLIYANRAARREFHAGNALAIVAGSVRCTTAHAQAELMQAVLEASVKQRTRLLSAGPPDQALPIVVQPINPTGAGAASVLVMMGRRALCSPLGLEMLASRHGLTLAERRVFRALISDQSARQIANTHGVALTTVRTQIQSIRDKVGVRSIEALLLRTAQLPPVSSCH